MTLILFIITCEAVGLLSSFYTREALGTWYAKLKKPSFNPPAWLFGPVWVLLYALMGISAWLVSREGWLMPTEVKFALFMFFLQLVVNGAWSFIFFGAKLIQYALADIVMLLMLIILLMFWFYIVSPLASLLLLPYLAWVGFATVLNYSIWKLNKA